MKAVGSKTKRKNSKKGEGEKNNKINVLKIQKKGSI